MQENDLDLLANWAEPMLRSMESKERRKLMRTIATKVRKSNMERMKRQENPDGTPWKKRKKASRKRKVHKSVEFLYNKGGGSSQLRRLQSWRSTKEMMTGYDPDAGGIRTFRKDRVVRYTDINTSSSSGRRLRSKKGSIRKKGMFTKLRTSKFLKIQVDPNSGGIKFAGAAADIARVHQYGLRAPVVKGGVEYDYPQRQLLGFSKEDLEMIADEIMAHVSP